MISPTYELTIGDMKYIMTSGLEGDGNSFMPDKAIERDDVINLIWTRNGKDESCFAPSVIIRVKTKKLWHGHMRQEY